MANLKINFPSDYPNVSEIPMRVDIRDVELDLLKTDVVHFGDSLETNVEPGIYVIKAELPSGSRMQEVVRVEGTGAEVTMSTAGLSPHEHHAWAYMNKNVRQVSTGTLNSTHYEDAWVRLWRNDGTWQTVESEFGGMSSWDDDGVFYELESWGGPQFLQVGGPGVPWKCVALPGAQNVKVLIRPALGPEGEVHPLDVVVSSYDTQAEAILSLLETGNVVEAKVIENAGAAEQMLYGKMVNPSGAAIGGYYLLKIRDLDRLHNWTENLANWIDWMADGPVIRAWHLLKTARLHGADKADTHSKAREHLLEAVKRGVPTYTEGLRLLRDGLNMLCQDQSDVEALEAKKIIDRYTESCDWSSPMTTFLGARPDEPSPEPVLGEPESLNDLVYLFNVDTKELIRQGVVNVGQTLSFYGGGGVAAVVKVEEGGELNLDGKRFQRFQDVAESVGFPNAGIYEWELEETGKSLYDGINPLRHGKLTTYEK